MHTLTLAELSSAEEGSAAASVAGGLEEDEVLVGIAGGRAGAANNKEGERI